MRAETVTCDGCGRDLSTTGNSVDFRLELASVRINPGDGPVTDMMIYPPVDRTHHFCHLGCLKLWFDKR